MNDNELEQPLVLTTEELRSIRINSDRIKLIEKDKTILDMKIQLLAVQNALLDAQKEVVKREKMILEYQDIKITQEISEAKNMSKDELEMITSSRKSLIGKKWGFKPDTGEIVINEDVQTTD